MSFLRRAAAGAVIAAAVAGCVPLGSLGSLEPTLEIVDLAGLPVAMQNGLPVPTFEWQPRPRLELDGEWLVERASLDEALTMAARDASLPAIEDEAAGREEADHDDGGWERLPVPGTLNEPPDGEEGGAWYRHAFAVPRSWARHAVSIRFGSANYVADVWLNGVWLGYHEGGSTPFAFDAGEALRPGDRNVLAVRVHTIPLGTRSDIIPWGIIDWWNYGGLTGPVWLEAAPPVHVVRADVFPHLDALEIDVVLDHPARHATGDEPPDEDRRARLRLSIFPASVNETNVLDPDPRALVPDVDAPLAVISEELDLPAAGEIHGRTVSLLFGEADAWSPAIPSLYVLRVELISGAQAVSFDELWTTFGIRHVSVDPVNPRILLNGEAVFFRGVGLHAETLTFSGGELVGGTPAQSAEQIRAELEDARRVGADLLRTGHLPADPTMLMLADRLGFAVWEEIPLYHATPLIFERTMERGLPQQMLREMALRDMNHPSVLFHGLANESTGSEERTDALRELHEIDRAIDGTRLTGQAAYGWQPDDPTHEPLDVAGFTLYHGVFYGEDPGPDTRRALREAHAANPGKPIMALEFGRWADLPWDEERQRVIFEETYPALARYRADEPGGFVSGATWWTLHDFATQMGGIGLEDFGLFRADGSLRPAGLAAQGSFVAAAGEGAELMLDPELDRPRVRPPVGIGDRALAGYLAYGIALSLGAIGAVLFFMTHRGGRATGRSR
ncbi:MAG TPA: glycoside hydrolase family 2 TIM barrel-domain containing protein [Candidatus Binatia bacterium]|nr:glycoside hydrolase family 2 TIM barrel-domain containing protein [Candidatus Binatia bacterium]